MKNFVGKTLIDSSDSDSQTVQYQALSYEHLISQLKIKNTALAKASNLIEILEVEVLIVKYRKLEVEKKSRQEAMKEAEDRAKTAYEKQIDQLKQQIRNLEDRGYLQPPRSAELKRQDSRGLCRSNSRPLMSSRSKENSISKNSMVKNTEKQLSLQLKYYKKMILELSETENGLLQSFNEIYEEEEKEVDGYLFRLQQLTQNFNETFREEIMEKSKVKQMRSQLQKFCSLIREQQKIITDMKIYQIGLEECMKGLAYKLAKILEEHNHFRKPQIGSSREQIASVCDCIREWKSQKNKKLQKLELQNEQLRGVIDELIGLLKNKKTN